MAHPGDTRPEGGQAARHMAFLVRPDGTIIPPACPFCWRQMEEVHRTACATPFAPHSHWWCEHCQTEITSYG